MSYCRWSSDSHRCDIYAYEDVNGGWTVHVAGRKKDVPLDWKSPIERVVLGELASDAFPEAYAKWNGEYDALPWVDLTAPSAGKHFNVPDLEEFKALMLSLRAEGLRFPDEVLSAIDEEMAEQQSA